MSQRPPAEEFSKSLQFSREGSVTIPRPTWPGLDVTQKRLAKSLRIDDTAVWGELERQSRNDFARFLAKPVDQATRVGVVASPSTCPRLTSVTTIQPEMQLMSILSYSIPTGHETDGARRALSPYREIEQPAFRRDAPNGIRRFML